MKFKEKHLLPLALTVALTTSCSEEHKPFFKEKKSNDMGLLDDQPIKDNDKYGTSVTLHQVDVPVYREDGSRITDQYVLTRGTNSNYASMQSVENMRVKPVYLNGSSHVSFVKADDNNAIYTEEGFSGLFIDRNRHAVVVADANISEFTSEISIVRNNRDGSNMQRRNNNRYEMSSYAEEPEADENLPADTIKNVTLPHDSVKTDTLPKDTFTSQQFLDTLQVIRSKER
jgi:hypothetical protein